MAPDHAEIRRLVTATSRSLVPVRFPPRRDVDFVCLETGRDKNTSLFHDAYWSRQDIFACFIVRLPGDPQALLAAHSLKALLRTALRSNPAERALQLSVAAWQAFGSIETIDADVAVATLHTATGALDFGTVGTGRAVPLHSDRSGREDRVQADHKLRLRHGEFVWISVGDVPSPRLATSEPEVLDVVRNGLAHAHGAAAAAVICLKSSRRDRSRTFVLVNDVAEISPVLAEVAEYLASAGVPAASLLGFDVAMDEILTNIVLYAYGDGHAHEVVIDVTLDADCIRLDVRDDGVPFDAAASVVADTTSGLDDRPIGGLGLHFVKTVFDMIDYRRARGWNVLTLTKSLRPRDGALGYESGAETPVQEVK